MGSVGNYGSVSQKDIEDVKNAPFYYRNPNSKAPVADDFMYAFKYNNPLPTHDGKTDINLSTLPPKMSTTRRPLPINL